MEPVTNSLTNIVRALFIRAFRNRIKIDTTNSPIVRVTVTLRRGSEDNSPPALGRIPVTGLLANIHPIIDVEPPVEHGLNPTQCEHEFGLALSDDQDTMFPIGGNPRVEGTPLLIWAPSMDSQEREPQWVLTMAGAPTLRLAVAENDNHGTIRDFAERMNDPESLLLMAALLFPDHVMHLSSRMTAVARRKSKEIPTMNYAVMRQDLIKAGLSKEEATKRFGRMTLLAINSGGTRVVVAIGLQQRRYARIRTITPEEKALPYLEKRALIWQLCSDVAAPWMAKASVALESKCWRIAELSPYDTRREARDRANPILWVTKISEELWDDIRVAIEDAHRQLRIDSGTSF